MRNKFEALKAFQSWPREWQELCAEFWASDDEPKPQVFMASDLAIAPVRDCIDQGEMKLEPMPVRRAAAKQESRRPIRNCMRYTREEISEVESHLSKGLGPTKIAGIMMRKHPNHRTRESWRKMAQMAQYIKNFRPGDTADQPAGLEVE